MSFHDESRIPITDDFELVGYLKCGVRRGAGKPWQHASEIMRSRVYSKRVSPLLRVPKLFVDISGRKLTVRRKWMAMRLDEYNSFHPKYMMGQRRISLERYEARLPPRTAPTPAPAPAPAPPTGVLQDEVLLRLLPLTPALFRSALTAAPALPTGAFKAAASTPECSICYNALASTLFVGCGHRCACVECARKVGNKCPICRVESRPIAIYDA